MLRIVIGSDRLNVDQFCFGVLLVCLTADYAKCDESHDS